MRRPLPLIVILVALSGLRTVEAQLPDQPDQRQVPTEGLELTPPTSESFIKYWSTGGPSPSAPHTVYMQNISTDRTITVTEWEVYECRNIRGSACRVHTKEITIKPKDTIRLVDLFPDKTGEGFSFRYRFKTRWFEPAPE